MNINSKRKSHYSRKIHFTFAEKHFKSSEHYVKITKGYFI